MECERDNNAKCSETCSKLIHSYEYRLYVIKMKFDKYSNAP